jgi:hypothetical protein
MREPPHAFSSHQGDGRARHQRLPVKSRIETTHQEANGAERFSRIARLCLQTTRQFLRVGLRRGSPERRDATNR